MTDKQLAKSGRMIIKELLPLPKRAKVPVLRQITSSREAEMSKTVSLITVQGNLNLAHCSGLSWRAVAAPYGVNVR